MSVIKWLSFLSNSRVARSLIAAHYRKFKKLKGVKRMVADNLLLTELRKIYRQRGGD